MPLPDGWSSPADGSSSGSSSNSSTSGSGSGAVSGTGVPAKSGQQFTTDSGTHFYVTKHQTLSLPSTEFFKGGTAFGSYIYILTNQYLSGSTTIWKIYRVTPSTLSSAVQCTWYETSTLTGGLATDGTYFYILGRSYTSNVVRINVSGCGKPGDIYLPTTPYYSVVPTFAIDSGNLYFPGTTSSGYPYTYSLIKNSTNNGSYTENVPETLTTSHSTNWFSTKALAVNNGNRWAVFSESYTGYTLWKFDSYGTYTVGAMPSKVLDTYIYPSQAGFLSDGTLVLINYSYQVDLIYFDLSEF